MRIRSIKPEFWRSRDIAKLDWDTRLVFIGLWSYVDDNGVGKDIDYDIIGDLFASDLIKDPRETVARVSRALASLSEAGLIYRYEVDNTPYLEIATWSRHQRIDKPGKPRYPSHKMSNPNDFNGSDLDSRDCRESVARLPRDFHARNRGTEEQGNRGTEDIYSSLSPQNPESAKTEKSADESASELEKENDVFDAVTVDNVVEDSTPNEDKTSTASSKKRKVPKKEKKPSRRTGTTLTPDWKPSPDMLRWVARNGIKVMRETELFVAYYTQERPDYRCSDWNVTYKRWVEKDIISIQNGRDPNNVALNPEKLRPVSKMQANYEEYERRIREAHAQRLKHEAKYGKPEIPLEAEL